MQERYPDESFEDRRPESDFAHVSYVISGRGYAQRPRNWQSARVAHAFWKAAFAASAIAFGLTVQLINANNDEQHLGGRLRPRFDRRLCHPDRSRAKNCFRSPGETFANEKARLDRRPTRTRTPICSLFRHTITPIERRCSTTHL